MRDRDVLRREGKRQHLRAGRFSVTARVSMGRSMGDAVIGGLFVEVIRRYLEKLICGSGSNEQPSKPTREERFPRPWWAFLPAVLDSGGKDGSWHVPIKISN